MEKKQELKQNKETEKGRIWKKQDKIKRYIRVEMKKQNK